MSQDRAGAIGDDRQVIDGALRIELEPALAVGDRANNAVLQGDPTEGALVLAARKAGLEDEALDLRFERVGEVPFSSERKLMTTIHTDAEQKERLLVFTKGAPDVLLGRCSQELVARVGLRPKAWVKLPELRVLSATESLSQRTVKAKRECARLKTDTHTQSQAA